MTEQPNPQKKMMFVVLGIWVGVCLGATVIFVLVISGGLPFGRGGLSVAEGPAEVIESDAPAPDFELVSTSGEQVNLSDFRGKVVVLNFWATWCGPCVREMPYFQEFQDKHPGFVMIGIDEKEKASLVNDFLASADLSYLMLLDDKAEVGRLYQVMVLPTTFFIDEEGIIRFRHIGSITKEQLGAYLGSLGVLE